MSGTRIDLAHAMRTDSALEALSADALGFAELAQPASAAMRLESQSASHRASQSSLAEQLERQTQQIQQHLARKLADIDRRESRLNAESAEMETQVRAARLWLVQRQSELDEREARLAEREKLVAEKHSQIAAAEMYQDQLRRELEQQLADRQREFDRRAAQLEAQRQRIEIEHQMHHPPRLPQATVVDRLAPAASETSAVQSSEKISSIPDRGLPADARAQFIEQFRRARKRLVERARRWSAQLQRRERKLQAENDRLRLRRVELEQLRLELAQKHRELSERRIALQQVQPRKPAEQS